MWQHFCIFVLGLTAIAAAIAATTQSSMLLPKETEESIVRLLALTLLNGLAQKGDTRRPVLPPLPDPLDLSDTYITLPENAGNLTFCHVTASGTSWIRDNLEIDIWSHNLYYTLDSPLLHFAGKHDVNFALLGGLIKVLSLEDYSVDLVDLNFGLDVYTHVELDGEFEILDARTRVNFGALVVDAPTFVNDKPFDWSLFNDNITKWFDTIIWPELKPRVDAQVLKTSRYMFQDCNIYTLIDGDFSCINTGRTSIRQQLLEETNKIFRSAEGICPPEPPKPTTLPPDGAYLVYSDNITYAGTYPNVVDRCPRGTYVNAFQVKTEGWQGPQDDTAMNGLRLFCAGTYESVTSKEGAFGKWGKTFTCGSGGLAEGFQMRVEREGFLDNTAANNIRILCSYNTLEGDGMTYGDWGAIKTCDPNFAICGLKTQVEPDKSPLNDDTALNNIAVLCCPV